MTGIVPIAVSVHQKSRSLKTVQFYVHGKMKLSDQIVELQELEDNYPYLRNMLNQTNNLNEAPVILGQNCYEIHLPFESKKSEDEIKEWLSLKCSATSEASSNSCHSSNTNRMIN